MRIVAGTSVLVSGAGLPKLTAVFDDPAALVAAVAEAADMVEPTERVAVLADEPDNRVLEVAAGGQADVIVTGDKAMRELGSFRASPSFGCRMRGTLPAAGSHRATRWAVLTGARCARAAL